MNDKKHLHLIKLDRKFISLKLPLDSISNDGNFAATTAELLKINCNFPHQFSEEYFLSSACSISSMKENERKLHFLDDKSVQKK